jgi:probable HAF family extracellular repeat protein
MSHIRFQIICAACAAVGIWTVGTASAETRYNLVDLWNQGEALGINSHGDVVGYSTAVNDSYGHVFAYINGTVRDLGRPAADNFAGKAINDSGVIVGGSGAPYAFYWDAANGGKVLSVPGSLPYHWAGDINDAGHIVATNSDYYANPANCYLLREGIWSQITPNSSYPNIIEVHLNNHDQVVGQMRYGSWNPDYMSLPQRAFYWDESDGIRDLGTLGGTRSAATDISDAGDIVGWADTSAGIIHAFLYRNQGMVDLGTLGGAYSEACNINANDQIVGMSETSATGTYHGFIYDDGAMRDINDLVDDRGGFTIVALYAINDSGLIAGYATDLAGQAHGVLLMPVPEPATLGLLALGGMVLLRRGVQRQGPRR